MKRRRILAAFLSGLTLAMPLGGCKKEMSAVTAPEEVVIPAIFLVDPETGTAENQEFVERFNEAYDGVYRVEVEWITETVEGYRERLKELNALDKLPAVITDVALDEDFYRMLVDNDRLVDLTEYMDDEWVNMMDDNVLEECTEKDGTVYMSPIVSPIYSFSGIIYNREMLKEAGYTEFPNTWDGFFECLKRLEAVGYTPLALQGGGTFWAPMLIATAYCARNVEGREFLREQFPSDYENEAMGDMLECLKILFRHTYEDALALDYSSARQRLLDGKAAMIANGYWIFETLSTVEQTKFGFAAFPEQILMASPKMTAWAATADYSEDVIRGAAELLRFRVESSKQDSEAFMATSGTAIINDYKEAVKDAEHIIPNYQLQWEQEIQNEFFNEYIPAYLNGEVSKEQFLKEMSRTAADIKLRKAEK